MGWKEECSKEKIETIDLKSVWGLTDGCEQREGNGDSSWHPMFIFPK